MGLVNNELKFEMKTFKLLYIKLVLRKIKATESEGPLLMRMEKLACNEIILFVKSSQQLNNTNI